MHKACTTAGAGVWVDNKGGVLLCCVQLVRSYHVTRQHVLKGKRRHMPHAPKKKGNSPTGHRSIWDTDCFIVAIYRILPTHRWNARPISREARRSGSWLYLAKRGVQASVAFGASHAIIRRIYCEPMPRGAASEVACGRISQM